MLINKLYTNNFNIYNKKNLTKSKNSCHKQTYSNNALNYYYLPPTKKVSFKSNLKEIEQIKKPTPNYIRTSEELSPDDILKLFEHQQDNITLGEIEELIAKYPMEKRIKAMKTLTKLSQFASYQSFNIIFDVLKQESNEGNNTYWFGLTSLSDSIAYLSNKSYKGEYNKAGEFNLAFKYSQIDKKGNLLLDKFMLEEIETHPELVEKIKQYNIGLIYPEGWINGINPFNFTTLQDIKERTDILLKEAENISKSESLDFDASLVKAINKPIFDKLKPFNLEKNVKVILNPQLTKDDVSIEKIQKTWKPAIISSDELSTSLLGYEGIQKQAVLEMLAQSAEIISPRRMNLMMQDQHRKVLNYAKQENIPEENIYYYVHIRGKSYSLATMNYLIANNIHSNKVFNQKDEKRLPQNDKSTLIVVIDDFAGTGSSLNGALNSAYMTTKNPKIVAAPLILTSKAKSSLEWDTISSIEIKGFKDTEYFNLLDSTKIPYFDFIGKCMGNTYTNLVLPYMAPDNNNNFFAENIAPYFTLNKRGVKKGDGVFSDYL